MIDSTGAVSSDTGQWRGMLPTCASALGPNTRRASAWLVTLSEEQKLLTFRT